MGEGGARLLGDPGASLGTLGGGGRGWDLSPVEVEQTRMAVYLCPYCLIPLGSSNFRTNKTRGTGKEAYCRSCSNQRRKRRKHRARVRQVLAELETFQRSHSKETARALSKDST